MKKKILINVMLMILLINKLLRYNHYHKKLAKVENIEFLSWFAFKSNKTNLIIQTNEEESMFHFDSNRTVILP
jgi:hypothetical protein